MITDTRLGTVEDVLAPAGPSEVEIARQLRDIIIRIDPDTTEQPRPGDRALSYGVGPKKMSEAYCYIMPQSGYVNLGFYRGADLPDPDGLLEGTGKAMRHVKIRSLEDADRSAVRDLITAAVVERKTALGADQT